MFKETLCILHGAFQWEILKLRLGINHRKVVVILVNDNKRLDYYAMVHIGDYMRRKYAKKAVVLLDDKKTFKMAGSVNKIPNVKIYRYPKKSIELLYGYYSFYKFSDEIVFTYTDTPRDNRLGKVLEETGINEEDAICLGLYHLRRVPCTEGRINV